MYTVKMFNTSLERFKIQCDSRVFKFLPRQATEVPEYLANFVLEQCRNKGVFALYPSMTIDETKKAARAALIAYLDGTLHERIVNYYSQQDEFRKKGVTLLESPKFAQALKWEKEIRAILELEAPLEEDLSFNSDPYLGLNISETLKEKLDEGANMFDRDLILGTQPTKVVEAAPKRRGQSAKSFNDIDIEKEIA